MRSRRVIPSFVVIPLLALVAGLAYALYVLAAKASLARSAPLPLTALTFTVGAALLTPALLWTEAPLSQVALGWPWLLYLGGVGVVQLTLMFVWGALFFGLELWSHIPGFLVMTLATALASSAFGLMLASVCHSRMR